MGTHGNEKKRPGKKSATEGQDVKVPLKKSKSSYKLKKPKAFSPEKAPGFHRHPRKTKKSCPPQKKVDTWKKNLGLTKKSCRKKPEKNLGSA